jgi:hypothetical protein
MSTKIYGIVVSNPDQDHIYNLDASIGGLSAQRRGLLTAAHELSHHVLAGNGANNIGTSAVANNMGVSAVFSAFELIASYWPPKAPPAFASTNPAAPGGPQWTPPAWISMLLHDIGYRSPDWVSANSAGMPSWTTTDFLGMLPGVWLRSDGTGTSAPAHGRLSGVFRLVGDAVTVSPLALSVRASLLRLIDTLLAMARLCLIRLMTLVREQRLTIACIRHSLGIPTFFRSVLAACRRYGRRSESDDHASLFVRQKLVSMGSYALAC